MVVLFNFTFSPCIVAEPLEAPLFFSCVVVILLLTAVHLPDIIVIQWCCADSKRTEEIEITISFVFVLRTVFKCLNDNSQKEMNKMWENSYRFQHTLEKTNKTRFLTHAHTVCCPAAGKMWVREREKEREKNAHTQALLNSHAHKTANEN